jgi:hypothetical protein
VVAGRTWPQAANGKASGAREKRTIQNERQLVAWIGRNLASTNAIREVVANLQFFGPETGNLLQMRLTAEAPKLPSLLTQSWRLIIRHMRAAKRDLAHNEWFDLQPELRRGDHGSAILERLSDVLRPQLQVSRRFRLYDTEDTEPQKPVDLMSIDFKVQDQFALVTGAAEVVKDGAGFLIDE